MRVPWGVATVLVLTLLWGGSRPANGGGFGKSPPDASVVTVEEKFVPARLPLSLKAARTWINLRQTLVKTPTEPMPFKDFIRFIKESTKGKDGKGEPLKVYVDRLSLLEAEITMETPIAPPLLGEGEVSLHTYLKLILKQLGLTHSVHDDLIVVNSPCNDCPEAVEFSAEYAWSWLLLHEEIALHFPDETPLRDVINTIQRATVGKRAGGRCVLFHLDLAGLKEVEKSVDSPVTFEIDRVPLCTSLGNILKPLGLKFAVGDDGVVTITAVDGGTNLIDEANVIENYQRLEYYYFSEIQRQKGEKVSGTNGTRREKESGID